MKTALIPLIAFAALAAVLGAGLGKDPAAVPSPLIGKPVPAFRLARIDNPALTIAPADMAGKVWLLNVWASWCAACRDEHPALSRFAISSGVPLVGLNYKDKREDGLAWLGRFGNPYRVTGLDLDGRVGTDFGVYGVPETFVIDKRGVIRYKFIGGLTAEVIREKLQPLLEELNRA
jgi:cytochrome c biogenesis protein CcmG/thiol:disulfide interchange protein DsbE